MDTVPLSSNRRISSNGHCAMPHDATAPPVPILAIGQRRFGSSDFRIYKDRHHLLTPLVDALTRGLVSIAMSFVWRVTMDDLGAHSDIHCISPCLPFLRLCGLSAELST